MRKLFLALFAFMLFGCSGEKIPYRIALDPSWPLLEQVQDKANFEAFVDELLLELAKEEGIVFEKISVSSSSLKEGLDYGRYDAILTMQGLYDFVLPKYAFSLLVLSTGPVIAYRKDLPVKSFEDFDNRIVAVPQTIAATPLLERASFAIIKNYTIVVEAFEKLQNREYDGVLVNGLIAASYIQNRFFGLKTTPALTDDGLRFCSLKEKKGLIRTLDSALSSAERKGKLQELKKKWLLGL